MIEESSLLLIAENGIFSRMYRTSLIGIQFDAFNDVKVYALKALAALLKYEAGFPNRILATVKEGEHIRIVIVSCTDGFNCKYFLNTLVGTYLNFALLPAYGGKRLIDAYKGYQKYARARNSAAKNSLSAKSVSHALWEESAILRVTFSFS
jgi:hypothetical protein